MYNKEYTPRVYKFKIMNNNADNIENDSQLSFNIMVMIEKMAGNFGSIANSKPESC